MLQPKKETNKQDRELKCNFETNILAWNAKTSSNDVIFIFYLQMSDNLIKVLVMPG